MRAHRLFILVTGVFIFFFLMGNSVRPLQAQGNLKFERDRGQVMLKAIKDDIKKNYYDPNYHGIDLEARFQAAEEKMKQAQSLGQIFGIVAQVLMDFDDSHTFFLPPSRTDSIEYGFQTMAVGDRCFVSAVKPGSDAEAQGLKPGDEVLQIGGFDVSREMLWKINYLFYTLRPTPVLPIVVRKPDQEPRQMQVAAKVKRGKRLLDLTGGGGGVDLNDFLREAEMEDRLNRHRYIDMGQELFIWKMPQFDLSESGVDELIGKARDAKGMILDLRGNGGGSETTLLRLAGYFIDKETKVGDLKGRKEMKPLMAKSRGKDAYKGKLVILIDSKSGSASEVLARFIQLEKRGTVLGDRSSGAVMRSRHHSHTIGADTVVFYGASVTDADLIMTDGKSLERVGVQPDETILPTPKQMASKLDPVMTRAAALLGVDIPPEKAGAFFPLEWRK